MTIDELINYNNDRDDDDDGDDDDGDDADNDMPSQARLG